MENLNLFGSRTIESDNNETNSLEFIINKSLQRINTHIPAIILEDQKDNDFFVSVQIAVNGVDGNSNATNSPKLYNVPVNFYSGGNAGIITNYKKGDKVLLGFCHRDISVFKKTFKVSNQNLLNVCDIEDAIVLCSLRNTPITTYIKITDEGIEIKTAKDIKIDCQNANINATTATITADCNLGGSGGSAVLTADAEILDSNGKSCTIITPGSTKVKAK